MIRKEICADADQTASYSDICQSIEGYCECWDAQPAFHTAGIIWLTCWDSVNVVLLMAVISFSTRAHFLALELLQGSRRSGNVRRLAVTSQRRPTIAGKSLLVSVSDSPVLIMLTDGVRRPNKLKWETVLAEGESTEIEHDMFRSGSELVTFLKSISSKTLMFKMFQHILTHYFDSLPNENLRPRIFRAIIACCGQALMPSVREKFSPSATARPCLSEPTISRHTAAFFPCRVLQSAFH
jgi:hypothetical protein